MQRKSKSFCQVEHLELRQLLSTIYVDAAAPGPTHDGSSWADAWTTVQAALFAPVGSVIEVAQGTYTPGNARNDTFTLTGAYYSLEGGFAGYGTPDPDANNPALYPTILSGDIGTIGNNSDNSYNVVTISNLSFTPVLLDGFTITGGDAVTPGEQNGSIAAEDGGGIFGESGDATIENCIITGNTAQRNGGGIYSVEAELTLSQCTITGNTAGTLNANGTVNTAGTGGGLFDTHYSSSLTDCLISDNTATDAGGGIADENISPTLSDCTISGNTAATGGGLYNDNGSAPTLIDCTITGNRAASGSGIANVQSSDLTLKNCTITDNSASADGGGLNDSDSSPDLIDCLISGNSAANGSGIWGSSGAYDETLTNCTMTGNTVTQTGGSALYDTGGIPTLTNCILWADAPSSTTSEIINYSGHEVPIFNCDIEQNIQIIDPGTTAANIDIDPLFVRNAGTNGPSDLGDEQLQSGSPAINTGSNSAISSTQVDLDRNPRIVSGIVDMGAYEYQTVQPIYVDAAATKGLNNGTTWANAFTSLQSALSAVTTGATLDVAGGTYKPTTATTRTATFQLRDDVTLDGGFAGDLYMSLGASSPNDRDVSAYPATLSGDISTAAGNSGNSYHVVTGSGTNSTAVLDGFTITGGNANGNGDSGGGISNIDGSPTIADCTITGNAAWTFGAGVDNERYSSPTFINCTITGNTSLGSGGGMSNNDSSPTLINCTVSGNHAQISGGAVANVLSSATLTNCILWGDTAVTDNEISSDAGSTIAITYSDIDQSGYAGSNNNIDSDPQFIRPPGTNGPTDYGDLHLQFTSPAIDVGNNAAIQAVGITTDLDGNPRIIGGKVDMGAYEARPIIYVNAGVTGGTGDGTTWLNAYASLAVALTHATAGSGQSIDVAQGTYYPTTGTDGAATFQLENGVAIYGGYAVIGTLPIVIYNVAAYPTILSGNLGTANGNSYNSYHVVTASNTDSTAILDGFTITGGNASGANGSNSDGGGIYDNSGDPTINDCIISGNTAKGNGGGMYNQGSTASPSSSSPTLLDCTISGNAAQDGAGMENVAASVTLTDCTLSGNTSVHGGAGLYDKDSSAVTLVNCVISGNSAGTRGGAIRAYGDSSATLTNCTLSGNSATSGGAIFGGSSTTLTNCILYGDTATAPGGGNELDSASGIAITYSDIDQSGYAGSNNNIDSDPQFIRPPGTNGPTDYGDLHLQFTSPAIDVGNNAAIQAVGITTDLDGNQRIFNFPGANDPAVATVDMGAYELGYNLDEIIVPAGQLRTLPAGGYPFSANLLSIGTGGTLDVADDTLTLNYGLGADPISSVAGWIDSGYAGGAWSGTGIISSASFGKVANATGVGYFDNNNPLDPANNSLKIGRTWYGDANLDGVINSDDLALMMLGQAQGETRWQDGNFNYGTQVNADDWSQFFYVNAYSAGKMLPGYASDASIQNSQASALIAPAANSTASPFAQAPIFPDGDLSDLLLSPAGD